MAGSYKNKKLEKIKRQGAVDLEEQKIPLLVIVGPTASGKTGLAIALAQALGGEVISADSMQIYKKMDIATAKPTVQEQGGVPHHLINLLDPGEDFSVAQYTDLAHKAIQQVYHRGKIPILAGGTGLYIQAVVDNIMFSPAPSLPKLREKLRQIAQEKGNKAVWEQLYQLDPEAAADLHPNNLGRVIRAIELYQATGLTIAEHVHRSREMPSPYNPCLIGLDYEDRQALYTRINLRVEQMLQKGLVEEAKQLLSGPLAGTAAQAIGYKELQGYFSGNITLEDAVDNIKRETRRYAKRQLSWLRRDKRIHWIFCDRVDSPQAVFTSTMAIVGNWQRIEEEGATE